MSDATDEEKGSSRRRFGLRTGRLKLNVGEHVYLHGMRAKDLEDLYLLLSEPGR